MPSKSEKILQRIRELESQKPKLPQFMVDGQELARVSENGYLIMSASFISKKNIDEFVKWLIEWFGEQDE